jgi:hypothetical protein
MKKSLLITSASLLCVGVLLAAIWIIPMRSSSGYAYNQVITIEFEYGGETITRSAAQSIAWQRNNRLGSVNGPSWLSQIKGEMPFLLLNNGGVVLALLRTDGDADYIANLALNIQSDVTEMVDKENLIRSVLEFHGPIDIPNQYLPLFAYLPTPNTPQDFEILTNETLNIKLPNLSLRKVQLSILPYSPDQTIEIVDILPYLENKDFQSGFSLANIRENPWVLPKHIYAN